jgi:hypothetical protein
MIAETGMTDHLITAMAPIGRATTFLINEKSRYQLRDWLVVNGTTREGPTVR